MALLYKLPLGVSILEQFVEELKDEEQVLLILPNRYQMEKVQFSGVCCTGIDTLANRILNENGFLEFEQINRRTQELLVEEFISMMMADGKFEYFANLAEKEGFVSSITSFIGQLARTGLTYEEIKKQFEIWQDETGRTSLQIVKDKEVIGLYQAYRNYLKLKNWYDLEGKYRLAVHLLKQAETVVPWKKLRVFGFYTLDKLQIDLFRELSKRVDLSMAMYYGETDAYLACRNTYNSLLGFCKECNVVIEKETTPGDILVSNFLARNNSLNHSSKLPTKGVRIVRFASHEKEIRYVLTDIKNRLLAGVNASDIVIVVRKLDNFSGIGSVSEEYGIPISLGKSCKLSNHSLFRLVRLLYQASRETHEGAENYFKLIGFISNGNLSKFCLNLKKGHYFTSSSEARRMFKDACQEDLSCIEEVEKFISESEDNDSVENFVCKLKDILKKFEFPQKAGRDYKEGKISLDGLKSMLEALRTLDNCLDMILEDYKLCSREKETVHISKWLDILAEAANDITMTLTYGRSDGIRVMEAANMQGLTYEYVYLVGLRRDEFPAAKNESWIYNDKEREGLDMDLQTTYASFNEDAYFFASTLASANKEISFSYYEEEQGEKSPYIDELQRIFLNKIDGRFVSNLQIEEIDDKEIASPNELYEKEGMRLPVGFIGQYYPEEYFNIAMECADMAKTDNLPRFFGKIEDDRLIYLLKKKVGNKFSASDLNTYLSCPYAYLLKRILQFEDGKYKEEEGSPADKGTIIHNTLKDFINNHLETKLDFTQINDLLLELELIFEKAWMDPIVKGVVYDSPLWQAEKHRIFKTLSNWLIDEINTQQKWNYRPLVTELKFFGSNTNPTVKLRLTDGSKVELQGAIDRIDRNGENIFITDYKLSNNSVPSSTSLTSGQDLQMDIYMLAANGIFKENVAGGGYYVMYGLNRKRNLLFEDNGIMKKDRYNSSFASFAEFEETAKSFIVQLIENIYSGLYTPSGTGCEYCPYKDVCRINAKTAEEECVNA